MGTKEKEKTKKSTTAEKKKSIRHTDTARRTSASSKEIEKEDLSSGYNKFKSFKGKTYTGMKVGRSHKWYYDQGEWKEKKVTPDAWDFSFNVIKRRAGKAPEGSGVPVGTEYHWYILADQYVRKLDANNYTTEMSGMKFKLNHKRAEKDKWSTTDKTERKRLIKVLEMMLKELKEESDEQ